MRRTLATTGLVLLVLVALLVLVRPTPPDVDTPRWAGPEAQTSQRMEQERQDRLSWNEGLEFEAGRPLRLEDLGEFKRRSDGVTEYRVSGTIRDAQGTPLRDALVTAYPELRGIRTDSGSPVSRARSDQEGTYEIKAGQPLKGLLVVTSEGYAQVEEEFDLPDPGLLRLDYILRQAPATIIGTVVDGSDGRPLSGALVKWSTDADSRFYKNWSPRFVRSAPDGGFEFKDLPLGRGSLSAQLPGYFGGEKFAAAGLSTTRVLLRLARGPSITLTVEDQDERVVSDAFVSLPGKKTMRTGREGSLTIAVDPEWKTVPVDVWADGYLGGRFELDGKIDRSTIYLKRVQPFSGRVLSQVGRPVQQVSVHVYDSRASEERSGITKMTDAAGYFSVAIAFPPLKTLRLTHPDFVEEWVEFENWDAAQDVEIRLQPRDTGLSGLVTRPDGQPLVRFLLELRGDTAEGTMAYTRAFENASGRFAVTDVPSGNYVATFAAQEQIDSSRYSVFQATADVHLEVGKITRLDIRTEGRQERGFVRF